MTLQTTVAAKQGFGVPGEIFLDGPTRAQPGIIDSDGVSNPNRVGRAFTQVAGADGHCTIGGTGVFYGWLSNPKVYPNRGTTGDTLAPSLDLPQYAEGEFVYDATGYELPLAGAGNIGDAIYFDTTTGIAQAQAKTGNVGGAGRVTYATNVATVATLAAGQPVIGVGSVFLNADGSQATVISLGSGTGGNGTYNMTTTPDHASEAFTYSSVAPSGKQRAPGWEVVRYNIPSAGLAVIGQTT